MTVKSSASTGKTTQPAVGNSSRHPCGDENAVAIAPPAYGIDFVDDGMRALAPVQRVGKLKEEEKEPLQGKFDAGAAHPAQATAEPPPNRTGMPDSLKAGIESLSGMDLSDVRLHANSDKPAKVDALAYAQGDDIYLARGQEAHLPHEAWHVVQQRQGRVKPTLQTKGVPINDDRALEREADLMGARAASGPPTRIEATATRSANDTPGRQPVQRWYEFDTGTSKFVENNKHPVGYVPLGDYWVKFKDEYNSVEAKEAPASYNPKLPVPSRWDQIVVQGDINGINNTKEKSMGCSIFVAADHYKEPATTFFKRFTGDEAMMKAVMSLFKQKGDTGVIVDLYKNLKLLTFPPEAFASLADMIAELQKAPDTEWSGAIAWEGHIVRAAGTGPKFTAWDPQGGLGNYLIPNKIKVVLITFSWKGPQAEDQEEEEVDS